MNESLIKKPIQTPELKNSLCIFDDIDSISNPKIKKQVHILHDAIAKKGSSKDNIDVIVTNHALTDYRNTRDIIVNTQYFMYFKGAINLDGLFKKLNITKQQAQKINSIDSRYYIIHKNYPSYLVTDKGIVLL